MTNPDIECMVAFTENGRIIKEQTDPMILKYIELRKKNYLKLDDCRNVLKGELLNNYKLGEYLIYKRIKNDIINELSCFGYTTTEIADILVKYSYEIKDDKFKDVLWVCYGDVLLANLQKHIRLKEKVIQCEDCGAWFNVHVQNGNSCKCGSCYIEHRKRRKVETQRERRRLKSQVKR